MSYFLHPHPAGVAIPCNVKSYSVESGQKTPYLLSAKGKNHIEVSKIGIPAMLLEQLKRNTIIRGPIFPEPVQVIMVESMGDSIKLVGKGLTTGQVHEPILNLDHLAQLTCTAEKEPFDGDPRQFRLGIEALRLGLAYEYDPYFSLSIPASIHYPTSLKLFTTTF